MSVSVRVFYLFFGGNYVGFLLWFLSLSCVFMMLGMNMMGMIMFGLVRYRVCIFMCWLVSIDWVILLFCLFYVVGIRCVGVGFLIGVIMVCFFGDLVWGVVGSC